MTKPRTSKRSTYICTPTGVPFTIYIWTDNRLKICPGIKEKNIGNLTYSLEAKHRIPICESN